MTKKRNGTLEYKDNEGNFFYTVEHRISAHLKHVQASLKRYKIIS